MEKKPKTWQDETLVEICDSLSSIAKSLKSLTQREVPKALNGAGHKRRVHKAQIKNGRVEFSSQ